MPAILFARDYDAWLDCEETDRPPVHLLRTLDGPFIEIHPASRMPRRRRGHLAPRGEHGLAQQWTISQTVSPGSRTGNP